MDVSGGFCHKYATFEVIVFMAKKRFDFFFQNIVAFALKSYIA